MGCKTCEIELLISLANTEGHFNIYEIIMKHIKQTFIDNGLVEGEDFTIKSMDDICMSKEMFDKHYDIIKEISNDYFPVYAKTFLIPEEVPTWNDFFLDTYSIKNAAGGEDIIISLAWNDNEPPEVVD